MLDILESFETESYCSPCQPSGDSLVDRTLTVSGKKTEGRFAGFVWMSCYDCFSGGYLPAVLYSAGIAADKYSYDKELDKDVPVLGCGVSFRVYDPQDFYKENRPPLPVGIVGDAGDKLLIERDDSGRITFCGAHKEGVRHGMGSQFSYDADGGICELRGVWQDGVHVLTFTEDRLVGTDKCPPVSPDTLRKAALLCENKVSRIADADDPCEVMGECIKLLSPYCEGRDGIYGWERLFSLFCEAKQSVSGEPRLGFLELMQDEALVIIKWCKANGIGTDDKPNVLSECYRYFPYLSALTARGYIKKGDPDGLVERCRALIGDGILESSLYDAIHTSARTLLSAKDKERAFICLSALEDRLAYEGDVLAQADELSGRVVLFDGLGLHEEKIAAREKRTDMLYNAAQDAIKAGDKKKAESCLDRLIKRGYLSKDDPRYQRALNDHEKIINN